MSEIRKIIGAINVEKEQIRGQILMLDDYEKKLKKYQKKVQSEVDDDSITSFRDMMDALIATKNQVEEAKKKLTAAKTKIESISFIGGR